MRLAVGATRHSYTLDAVTLFATYAGQHVVAAGERSVAYDLRLALQAPT